MSQSLIVDTLRKCRNRPTSQSSILFVIVSIVNTCEAIYLQRYDVPTLFSVKPPSEIRGFTFRDTIYRWFTDEFCRRVYFFFADFTPTIFCEAIFFRNTIYFDVDGASGVPGKVRRLVAIGYLVGNCQVYVNGQSFIVDSLCVCGDLWSMSNLWSIVGKYLWEAGQLVNVAIVNYSWERFFIYAEHFLISSFTPYLRSFGFILMKHFFIW